MNTLEDLLPYSGGIRRRGRGIKIDGRVDKQLAPFWEGRLKAGPRTKGNRMGSAKISLKRGINLITSAGSDSLLSH